MADGVEMFGGMLILGGIAAADVTADHAQTQVDPGIAHLDALFTDMGLGVGEFGLVGVLAGFGIAPPQASPSGGSGLVVVRIGGGVIQGVLPVAATPSAIPVCGNALTTPRLERIPDSGLSPTALSLSCLTDAASPLLEAASPLILGRKR